MSSVLIILWGHVFELSKFEVKSLYVLVQVSHYVGWYSQVWHTFLCLLAYIIHMNYKCARLHFHDVLLYAFLSLRTHVFPFDLQVANLLCLHLTVSYKGAELSKFKLRTEVKKMFCDMKSLFCPRAYFDPCHLAIQVNQELSGYFPIDLCFR